MSRLLIISFDAVGDDAFDQLMELPNFRKLAEKSRIARGLRTVFLSNTYPIHASVVTGVVPGIHGVYSNTKPFPSSTPVWLNQASAFHIKPLWQLAAEQGLSCAAVFWPVTAKSPHIRYNIPEVMARPGKSQMLTSLMAGSKSLQVKMFLKYRNLLNGLKQPELDLFATACMADILKHKKPALSLMHLVCYDAFCHKYGKGAPQLETAKKCLDANLGILLAAAGRDTSVLLFTDHSQKNVQKSIVPNAILEQAGYIKRNHSKWEIGVRRCFFECCGGSAFFHKGTLTDGEVQGIRNQLKEQVWFLRYLSRSEMEECGIRKREFGFCAKEGYSLDAFESDVKGQHGYPVTYDEYDVFYMVSDKGTEPGVGREGSLLEIAGIAKRILGLKE